MSVVKNLKKVIRYLTNREFRYLVNADLGLYDNVPDEEYITRKFRAKLGYPLNLDNPTTFNEKIQWLKLFEKKPQYCAMVDKCEAKKYVAEVIGEEYVVPLLGVWDSFDEIDFESLPERFVLKCTHDSGGLVIVKDKKKLNKKKARRKLEKSLRKDFFYCGREWPYKGMRRRSIAEEYLEDTRTKELRDYKFFCFNGEAKCYKVDFDRFIEHKANYYDMDSHIIEIGEFVCPPDFNRDIKAPEHVELMRELAEKLSAGLPFLRVDFYEVDGRVYFGEMTFYPNSGFGKFVFDGNDELLGSWIHLR